MLMISNAGWRVSLPFLTSGNTVVNQ
jgi:hypothetical protein